jgi:hypothetical protein
LAPWERHTDFSVLRSLQFTYQIDLDILQEVTTLAERDRLSCLKALDLSAISCEYEDRVEVESTTTRLFLSLHPLTKIGIDGAGVTTFEAILGRHGSELQVLCFEDLILSLQQVVQLRGSCPKIRELSIEILRSAGDHVEAETYQTLGSI